MAFCIFCDEEKEDFEYTVDDVVICDDCVGENSFTHCLRCDKINDQESYGEGFCERCWDYVDDPEWMEDNGGREEFMDSYDPDR